MRGAATVEQAIIVEIKEMVHRLLSGAVLWILMLGSASAYDNTYLLEDAYSGDAEAQYTLAHLYLKGKGGVVYDVEEAIKLLEQAAKRGHQMAAFDLGSLYLDGTRVRKDSGEALKWFTRSAEMGQIDAQYFLGRAYQTSDAGQAVHWLKRAAVGGHRGAAAELQRICSEHPGACAPSD